jgi:hypothetical protein
MLFLTCRIYKTVITLSLFTFLFLPLTSNGQLIIFDGSLPKGFSIGVDSHFGDNDWLEPVGKAMKLSYPGEQGWGALYITFGPVRPDSEKEKRKVKDLSKYFILSIDLKGAKGGEEVSIGMKDKNDLNNGMETKESVTLSTDWETYNFITKSFKTADLTNIHVPIEIIFGKEKATVYFKNIKFF